MISVERCVRIVRYENSNGVKTQLLQQHKENYAQKRMHSTFMRGTEEVWDDNNSGPWIKKISEKRKWSTDNGCTGSVMADKMGKTIHR